MSLQFSISPGYAVPLWPAAGLALGGLLVWGWRLWPAVWLGSFAANLVNQSVISGSETTPALPALLALAALIAAGAALQAVLGARLVRRFVEVADPLAQERHALCFLALAGPLACLVSATVGVAGLYFLQGLPAEALAANWIAWWAGDSLGVLLFAPLVLLALPESRRQWRGRALQIGVPLLVTGALVMAGYVWMNRAEEAAHRKQLAGVVEEVHHDLDTALTRHIGSVQALASLSDASEHVTRAEFDTFSRSALQWWDVQALAWITRVPRAQREAVEAAARRDGVRDFVFRERDSDNLRLVPAGERAEYYPALYIATREGKQSAALGLDFAAAAASRATLQRATDSARPVLAEREAFYDRDAKRRDDWRLYVAVYRAGFDAQAAGVEARREALRGFAVGVFYINKLFAPMEEHTKHQHIGYRLSNLSDPGSTRLLLESAVPAARASQPDTSRRIDGLAGNSLLLETWSLVPWQPTQSAAGQIYLLASVLITLLAAVFVLAAAGQSVRVTREVFRRTAELERSEKDLRERSVELYRFKNTLDQTLDCIFMFRPDTLRFTYVNCGALAQVGYSKTELLQMTPMDINPAFTEDSFRKLIRPLLDGRQASVALESRHRHKDGHDIPVAITLQLVHQGDGQSTFVAVVRDLTEQKRLNAALRQSEEQLRSILDNTAAFIGEVTPDGVLVEVNRAALEVSGQQREEVVGKSLDETYWFSYSTSVQVGMRDAIQRAGDGEAVRYDLEARVGDNRFITIDFVLIPVADAEGRIVKLVASAIDITERTRAEAEVRALNQNLERIVADRTAALRASERRFANLFEHAPNAVVMVDAQGRIKLVNQQAEALFGYSSEELVGQAVEILIPEGSRPQHASLLQGFFRKPSVRSMGAGRNLFAVRKDGSTFPADISLSPVEAEEGLLVAAAVRDVTARKQAEEAVQRQGEFLRLMTENLAEGVVACDESGHLSFFNKTARDWHGVDLLALPPEKWAEHYDLYEGDGTTPLATERVPLLRAFTGEEVRGAEMSIVAKGQPPRFIVASGSPLNDASGRKLGAVAVMHDVTERRQAAAEIEEQRLQLTKAQRLAHIGSWVWNLGTDEVVCSDEYLRLHGLTPGEVEPSHDVVRERMHPDDREMLRQRFEQAFQDHRPFEFQYRAVWPDGTERWLHGRGEVHLDGAGQPEQVSGTAQDITEQRKHEADRHARVTAESANAAKSAFLATMSHEIRTPMNGVLGMLELLEHSNLSEQQRDRVQTMRDSGATLLALIDDILDFSKIEAGRVELEHGPLCVADLVEGLCTSQLSVARRHGVALRVFVDPDIPERVLGDDTRLRQILYNLVGNAIKFSAGNPARTGRVAVRATRVAREPLRIAFAIEDNGIGMDDAAQARLFSPFTQAEASTTRRFGGTGLGLTICWRLVHLMGGEIGVQSRPDAGSVFTVTLPFALAPEQPLREQPDLSGLVCCLLDDEDLDAAALTRYLEHAGAIVQRCTGVGEAVACAQADAPAVLIHADDEGRRWQDGGLPAQLRRVRIGHGRRRRARLEAPDCVSLDGDVLLRQTFLRAVAVAAGRASPEIFDDRSTDTFPGESTPPPTVAQARAENRLILVAEDDSVNQKVALQQLALLGHAAEVASDGAEALARWEEGGFALLFTDLHMPAMDGYQLAAEIRRREGGSGRRLPIIALTANALRDEASRARAAGMDDYLTKPVALARLREVLDAWLPQETPSSRDGKKAAPETAAPETVSPRADAAAPVLDVAVLQRLVGDDPAILHDFLADYARVVAQAATELRAAAAAKDHAQLAAIAHKLKSSSRSVGALPLGDLCAELENAGKRNDAPAVERGMAQLETLFAEVEEELAPLLSEEKKT